MCACSNIIHYYPLAFRFLRFMYKKIKDMFVGLAIANQDQVAVAFLKKMLFGAFAGFRWFPSPFQSPGFFHGNPGIQIHLYFFEHSLETKPWPTLAGGTLGEVGLDDVCMHVCICINMGDFSYTQVLWHIKRKELVLPAGGFRAQRVQGVLWPLERVKEAFFNGAKVQALNTQCVTVAELGGGCKCCVV